MSHKVAVIGGGVAGLCAANYARRCGYEVDVFEMHTSAGGLATSWHRNGYTFETCLHWLLGSNPKSAMYPQWREVFDIEKLTLNNPQQYGCIEDERGERLTIYTDPDRMEAELLRCAPQDAHEIHRFASAVRKLSRVDIAEPDNGWRHNWSKGLAMLPALPALRWWSSRTLAEYSERFSHPLPRRFFGGGESRELSAIALVFSLAWMSNSNAGYPIGGSQAVIQLLVERLLRAGGRLHLGSKVAKISLRGNVASGIELESGQAVEADWVISAADGHETIFELLGGRYQDRITDRTYREMKTFPSYLQVSLGVAQEIPALPRFLVRVLDSPLRVDPGTNLSQVSFRFFHFDPTFAPPGKTAVTCFLPTRNYQFWVELQKSDVDRYAAEKHRIADEVIYILEHEIAGLRASIEEIDVSTPATVIRYTGNWHGSMQGWVLAPRAKYKPLRMNLPGLDRFLMVGQWVLPGGGFPAGLMTARSALQIICKRDGIPFLAQPVEAFGAAASAG